MPERVFPLDAGNMVKLSIKQESEAVNRTTDQQNPWLHKRRMENAAEGPIIAVRILDNAVNDTGYPKLKPKAWFSSIDPESIVALDVEFVEPIPKGKVRAATVCVCSIKDTFNFRVQHLPGTFKVTPQSFEVTGFKKDSLAHGQDFDDVKKQVTDLLYGKLVVGCALHCDFKALDLDPSQFNVLDLQEFFKKAAATGPQPISLRSLYWHYFKEDIQQGVHDAEKDAKATLKLFYEVYCELKSCGLREELHLKGTNDFEQFSSIQRLGKSRTTTQELVVKQQHLKLEYLYG